MALQEEEERGLSPLTYTKESMKTQQESDPLPARRDLTKILINWNLNLGLFCLQNCEKQISVV